MLYTPGSRPRALAKARQAGADALILDLEDAVAPAAKDEARDNVRAAVAEWGGCLPGGGCLVTVRVNGADTAWGAADLAMAAASSAHALVLPKVESAAQVRDAAAAIPAASPMRVWAMVETPRGVLNAAAIAGADARVSALVMGTSDLLKELRGRDTAPGRAALLPALGAVVLAARAHGLVALDGVHLDLGDDAGFDAACEQGRDLGFDGKTLIHPKTVARANACFAPAESEVAHAHAVIEAHASAVARGEGVVVLDGRLVENLHVDEARRVVALHDAVAAAAAADA